MPRIVSIGTAVPPHAVHQSGLRNVAREHFRPGLHDIDRLISVFDNVEVDCRYFCVPVEWFATSHTFEERNQLYNHWAEKLSCEAIGECLERAGVEASRIGHIVFVSTSGLSTPSIDARLINRLDFDQHVRRTPVFGLGCAGGAAGLSRCRDLALGDPDTLVLLVAVEISSLTFQPLDFSRSNLVASALFADGAAAVLVAGDRTGLNGVQILDTQSTLWANTLEVMGWDFSSQGFSVVFSKSIPFLLRKLIRGNVEDFLGRRDLPLEALRHFAVHPGGAKILESLVEALDLEGALLEGSRSVLQQHGNMSSPTVLFILKGLLDRRIASSGDLGLAAAFGPGFSSELLLLQW